MHRVEEEFIWGFGGKARKKEATRKTQTHEDNFKTDLRGIEWGGMNGIDLP
jgi:hypothetical protein